MAITRSDLRVWRTGPVMYRWSLRALPAGEGCADVHHALQREGYTDQVDNLVEYDWPKWREEASSVQRDTDAVGNIFRRQAMGEASRLSANAEGYARFGSVDDNVKATGTGYVAQIAYVGYSVRIGSVGYNTHIGSSGDRGRITIVGNSTRISSVGDGTRIANTDMRVRISSLGDRNWIASSDDLTQLACLSVGARIINCTDNIHITASGENAVVASTGAVDPIILSPGGCAALAYYDGERVRFTLIVEGENNIRVGVKYRPNEDHQFVEC